MVIDFDKFSGKAQVRRARLSCDSSYLKIAIQTSVPMYIHVYILTKICEFLEMNHDIRLYLHDIMIMYVNIDDNSSYGEISVLTNGPALSLKAVII